MGSEKNLNSVQALCVTPSAAGLHGRLLSVCTASRGRTASCQFYWVCQLQQPTLHDIPAVFTQICTRMSRKQLREHARATMRLYRPLYVTTQMHLLYRHSTHFAFSVMITHFRPWQTAEQQTQRCNGLILIAPRDRYWAALISYSWRKNPHLWKPVCHNTLSISYSPVSYSKLNSS